MSNVRAYAAVISLQFGFAGLSLLVKYALNEGMNHYTFVVYRHAIAFVVITPFALIFERQRPTMTWPIFGKILLLGLLEPVLDQNLYFAGMKLATATFASSMTNILPALTFVLAWLLRLEKVNIKNVRSRAKVGGTIVTVGGAMLMTLVKGCTLFNGRILHGHSQQITTDQNTTVGAIVIVLACICWGFYIILQAITLKSYPAELSLASLICLTGTVEGAMVALVAGHGDYAIWAIHFDSKLYAALYCGIICSGITYYVQGVLIKQKGPVFVTSFSPLSMVIVAVAGSVFFGEAMFLGRLIGAIVIVIGLYCVIWGQSADQSFSSSESNQLKEELLNNNGSMNILERREADFWPCSVVRVIQHCK